MDKRFVDNLFQAHQDCPNSLSPKRVALFFNELLETLFPAYSDRSFYRVEDLEAHLKSLKAQLTELLTKTSTSNPSQSGEIAHKFFELLPSVYEKISKDVQAMYEGDPAAKSAHEVVMTYPGFYAIAGYRVAHELYQLGVSEMPRMITETAHSRTGVDIHPGATIGDFFCIDHGTGIVIGETTCIGNWVKLYQGVTLGALSVNKEDAEKKRHPTIEDHVVIYAGATILGGKTVIGHHSVVGGNVWLTKSVVPHTKVYYQAKMNDGREDQATDLYVFKA